MTFQNQSFENLAKENGLSFFGSCDLDLSSEKTVFSNWISDKKHASMSFLEKNTELRFAPKKFFPEATSAFVFGLNYNRGLKKSRINSPQIAQYALITDYHKLLNQKLSKIAEQLKHLGLVRNFVVCVDTKPVLERALARKTQAGFIGKNTCFIHAHLGSYFLLGTLVTDSDWRENKSVINGKSGCGTCKRCQVHCPTGALNQDYQLDSNLCLSYWTIENRGPIPFEFWKHLKYFWYGCDLCQMVCPFNKKASLSSEKYLSVQDIPLQKVALMSQAEYESFFGGTSLTRAKIFGLQRNALIAMFASNHSDTEKTAKDCLISTFQVVRHTAEIILQKISKKEIYV